MNAEEQTMNDDQFRCPHCSATISREGDLNQVGYHRLAHLLDHAVQDVLGIPFDGLGDPDFSADCDVESASTWPRTAYLLHRCFSGQIGESIESMVDMANTLERKGALGSSAPGSLEQQAAMKDPLGCLRHWVTTRYPFSAAKPTADHLHR